MLFLFLLLIQSRHDGCVYLVSHCSEALACREGKNKAERKQNLKTDDGNE